MFTKHSLNRFFEKTKLKSYLRNFNDCVPLHSSSYERVDFRIGAGGQELEGLPKDWEAHGIRGKPPNAASGTPPSVDPMGKP